MRAAPRREQRAQGARVARAAPLGKGRAHACCTEACTAHAGCARGYGCCSCTRTWEGRGVIVRRRAAASRAPGTGSHYDHVVVVLVPDIARAPTTRTSFGRRAPAGTRWREGLQAEAHRRRSRRRGRSLLFGTSPEASQPRRAPAGLQRSSLLRPHH